MAEEIPRSSRRGGCNKYDTVRVSVTASSRRESVSADDLVVPGWPSADRVHFGQSQKLAHAVMQFPGKFAALFILHFHQTGAQTAGVVLHLIPVLEFRPQQAIVNPEEQGGDGEDSKQ